MTFRQLLFGAATGGLSAAALLEGAPRESMAGLAFTALILGATPLAARRIPIVPNQESLREYATMVMPWTAANSSPRRLLVRAMLLLAVMAPLLSPFQPARMEPVATSFFVGLTLIAVWGFIGYRKD